MENEKQNELIIPKWLFQEPIENKPSRISNPIPLRARTRDNIKLDDKQLNREIATKILNPFFFTDRILQVTFNITLKSHHINRSKSKLTIKPNFAEFGIEFRYINKIMKEMVNTYAGLINQYKLIIEQHFQ